MTLWGIFAVGVTALSAATLPNSGEIVRKSVANTQADWKAAPNYDFTERDVIVKKGTTVRKKYRVMMIDGSPYNELIGRNGEPLSPAQMSAQEARLRQEIAKRQHETAAQHRQRVAEYTRERRQDNALLDQMMQAMDYRLVGEDTLDGRRCFVLEGNPKPGYRPISRDTRVLKGMRGKMWIDEQQYQWVKVEAEVFRPVAFGLFIAKVEPGTKFTLEQAPVRDGLWLPSHFSMEVKARVLVYWSHNSSDDETYTHYVPASQANVARVEHQ
ncbi:MAG TPA: hypothetical protein VMB03_07995 [Bryobacteraceae bacterium]|nr:hypothetical protein [Bryobacteraceae bacterium]